MSFVAKIKGPDEKLIGVAYIHWIYGLQGILWLAGLMCFGLFIDHAFVNLFSHYQANPAFRVITSFSSVIFWVCTAIGLMLFFFHVLMIATTEVGLTDKRIIYKRGFLFVKTVEIDIEEIKAANVNNGVFGRILNYGYIFFDTRFVENMTLPALADPYRFVKAMNEMRSKMKEDSMHIVLDGASGAAAVNKIKQVEEEEQEQAAEAKKEHPHLSDKRYRALDTNPMNEITDLIEETHEDAQHTAQVMQEQTGKPVKVPRKMFRKEKAANESKPAKKLRPILFRQERMREDIKTDFSQTSTL